MTVRVAMYEKSLAHIGPRLDALALDISLISIDRDGRFLDDGQSVSANDLDIDYLWLSSHFKADGVQETVFDAVLACKSIGLLQTFNAGLDHPFYKKISDKGTRICNSSAQAVAISEYVMAQVLSVFHPIERQRALQAKTQWQTTPFRELSRSNWLVIGFGPIGQEICKRVKPFGADISVIRRTPAATDLADRVGTMDDLDAYLAKADIVVLACPLNATTRGFADAGFFGGVKQDAILVNIARGGLIEDRAMLAALDDGKLATAILDVFHTEPLPADDPLWAHPKVRLTCHTSFSGEGVQDRWDLLFLDNIARFVNGETLLYEVRPGDIS
ncbi:MAG: NAD(P)-binding domain-containing protein [Rhodospirillales bacterium]|nr:NAD(P)-binding domain-containing protein [Rhodospirillales bacterium]